MLTSFRYVYYADWLKSGDRIPFIGRCYSDGSHNVKVHQYELGWPNGMCIDFEEDRVYWVDAYFDRFVLFTVKILKIWIPQNIAVIILKFEQGCFNIRVMRTKDVDG